MLLAGFKRSWQALVVIGAPFNRFQKRLNNLNNDRALDWGYKKSKLTKELSLLMCPLSTTVEKFLRI